jgi:hypothetical protein
MEMVNAQATTRNARSNFFMIVSFGEDRRDGITKSASNNEFCSVLGVMSGKTCVRSQTDRTGPNSAARSTFPGLTGCAELQDAL